MPYRVTSQPGNPWFEKCARHAAAYTCRTIQFGYFCDPCAERLVAEAFNNRPFLYHGETVHGYCGLCNEIRDVTLRQQYACHPCWAVVQSYQKGFVAAEAVHDFWQRVISAEFPHLRLTETEPVRVEPYIRAHNTKKAASKTLSTLDYEVRDTTQQGDPIAFHIELKSGPASIETMSEFQLDVNDFDDIVGAACFTKLPAYVIHVQIQPVYLLPTKGHQATGAWWTDFARLRAALNSVKGRRGEDKAAAYFDPSAFSPFATFTDELRTQGYVALGKKLNPSALALPETGTKVRTAKKKR